MRKFSYLKKHDFTKIVALFVLANMVISNNVLAATWFFGINEKKPLKIKDAETNIGQQGLKCKISKSKVIIRKNNTVVETRTADCKFDASSIILAEVCPTKTETYSTSMVNLIHKGKSYNLELMCGYDNATDHL